MSMTLRLVAALGLFAGIIWAIAAIPRSSDCGALLSNALAYNACTHSASSANMMVPGTIAASTLLAALILFALARALDHLAETRAMLTALIEQAKPALDAPAGPPT